MGTTSIPCDESVRDALASEKPEDVTWNQYLKSLHEDGEIVVEPAEIDDEVAEAIIDVIGSEVGGPRVDDSELAREVSKQIDYAELATKVAEELQAMQA